MPTLPFRRSNRLLPPAGAYPVGLSGSLGLLRTGYGVLAWTGQTLPLWHWHSTETDQVTRVGYVVICWDWQKGMLLRWRDVSFCRQLWLGVFESAQPHSWHVLRRALYF